MDRRYAPRDTTADATVAEGANPRLLKGQRLQVTVGEQSATYLVTRVRKRRGLTDEFRLTLEEV